MNGPADILLARPLAPELADTLIFACFALHLLLVLLMLGTAMVAVYFFIHAWLTGRDFELRWDQKVLRLHLVFKTLAVVLGVGPLLLIQLLYSVPFLTAVGLLAPWWLLLAPLMVLAFLALDLLGHRPQTRPLVHLLVAVPGLAALLAVPAVFSGVLAMMERPALWASLAVSGPAAQPGLLLHWAARYLHILGAAALFGGAYHYFFSTRGHQDRQYHLSRWVVLATLFQVVVGVVLGFTVRERLGPAVTWAVGAGVLAAMALLALVFYRDPARRPPGLGLALVLLPVILVSMLLARQFLQGQALAPVQASLEANRLRQDAALRPFQEAAERDYRRRLATVHDNGETIYQASCAFCHGPEGGGDGPEAAGLIIPPENLAGLRAQRGYALELVGRGTPGSAMPYFKVFDRRKLEKLVDHLDQRFGLYDLPDSAPEGQAVDTEAARLVFARACARCHGVDGRGSDLGLSLRPAPPDLSRLGLMPERAWEVIARGYPCTAMQPFHHLGAPLRWGLVNLLAGLRASGGAIQQPAGPATPAGGLDGARKGGGPR